MRGLPKKMKTRSFWDTVPLEELVAADLSALDIVAVFIDGFSFGEHLMVAALGVDAAG